MIKKRGRPIGYKLSDESKMAISTSKTGQHHSQQTKDKISRSLITYFRNKHPFSSELAKQYATMRGKAWVSSVKDELDNSMDILTDRAMRNKQRTEVACGEYIEFFKHSITPELLVLFQECCRLNPETDCSIEDLIELEGE